MASFTQRHELNDPISPREQKQIIKEIEKELGGQVDIPTEAEEAFYILNRDWWQSWKDYVCYDTETETGTEEDKDDMHMMEDYMGGGSVNQTPSKIHNSILCDLEQIKKFEETSNKMVSNENNKNEMSNTDCSQLKILGDGVESAPLKENLERDKDYIYVSERIWTHLSTWYGINSPLDVLKRYTYSEYNGSIEIERNPLYFQTFCVDSKFREIVEKNEDKFYNTPVMWMQSYTPNETLGTVLRRNINAFNKKLLAEDEQLEMGSFRLYLAKRPYLSSSGNEDKFWEPVIEKEIQINQELIDILEEWGKDSQNLSTIDNLKVSHFLKNVWGGDKTKRDLFNTLSLFTTKVRELFPKEMNRILLIENFAWRRNIKSPLPTKVAVNVSGYDDSGRFFKSQIQHRYFLMNMSSVGMPTDGVRRRTLEDGIKKIFEVKNKSLPQGILDFILNLLCADPVHLEDFDDSIQLRDDFFFYINRFSSNLEPWKASKYYIDALEREDEIKVKSSLFDHDHKSLPFYINCRITFNSFDNIAKVHTFDVEAIDYPSLRIQDLRYETDNIEIFPTIEADYKEKKSVSFSSKEENNAPQEEKTATPFTMAHNTSKPTLLSGHLSTSKGGDNCSMERLELDLSQDIDKQVVQYLNNPSKYTADKKYMGDSEPGEVGLQNIGNTCFMNSMLQCLSNTKLLCGYFITDFFRHEINRTTEYGIKGKLALSYGNLMKQMWSGEHRYLIPKDLKLLFSSKYQSFQGYQQHDSQEFLNYLIDTLHEDTNRIHEKKFIDKLEGDGRPDQELAEQCWENHLKRENSFINDHFYGLNRSHLTCPQCKRESVTFDPYNQLQLPIPVVSGKMIRVKVLRLPDIYIHNQQYYVEKVSQLLNLTLRKAQHGFIAVQKKDDNKILDLKTAKLLKNHPWLQNSHVSTVQLPVNFTGPISALDIKKKVLNLPEFKDPNFNFPCVVSDDSENEMQLDTNVEKGEKQFIPLYMNHIELLDDKGEFLRDNRNQYISRYNCNFMIIESHHCTSWRTGKNNEGKTLVYPQNNSRIDYRHPKEAKTADERKERPEEYPDFSESDECYAMPKEYIISIRSMDLKIISSHAFPTTYTTKALSLDEPPVRMTVSGLWTCTDLYRDVWTLIKPYFKRDKHDEIEKVLLADDKDNEGKMPEDVGLPFFLTCAKVFSYSYYYKMDYKYGEEIPVFSDEIALGKYVNSEWDLAICFSSISVKEDYVDTIEYDGTIVKSFGTSDSKMEIDKTSLSDECKKREYDSWRRYPLGNFRVVDNSALLLSDEKEVDINGIEEDDDEDDGEITLQKCFKKFTQRETLDEMNTWYCNKCKSHVQADKKVDIWTTPDVLIIHLKRFYMTNNYYREKIEDLVKFPIEGLDLRSMVKGYKSDDAPPIYDLYAVSEHDGGLNGGHYTAKCQNFRTKKWYSFNDSIVRECNASDAVTDSAYVLMYQRREGSLRGGGLTKPHIQGMPQHITDEPSDEFEYDDEDSKSDVKNSEAADLYDYESSPAGAYPLL